MKIKLPNDLKELLNDWKPTTTDKNKIYTDEEKILIILRFHLTPEPNDFNDDDAPI